MKKVVVSLMATAFCLAILGTTATAQERSAKKRDQDANANAGVSTNPVVTTDTVVVPEVDSLPIPQVKKSLRSNDAIERNLVKDRAPLPYENIREDDAVYRQKIWREIDAREKMNLPFRYAANEDNGNQRFISILLKAIQDGPDNGGVTAFSAIDDRFTTPLTVAEVSKVLTGEPITVPLYDSIGNIAGYTTTAPEINLDSFYRFRIKEEVIFDKESSRLFWRILGIAPVKNIITTEGVNLGPTPMFWVYYPDMRPIFAKYEVYNGQNYGARMSWEELFESRHFHGRIIKSTLHNPYDQALNEMMGLKDHPILQLLKGRSIKNEIFDYEQNLWSY